MQINLFAEETQLQKLTKLGDSLEKLNIIDFESFRPLLVSAARKERKNNLKVPSKNSPHHIEKIAKCCIIKANEVRR